MNEEKFIKFCTDEEMIKGISTKLFIISHSKKRRMCFDGQVFSTVTDKSGEKLKCVGIEGEGYNTLKSQDRIESILSFGKLFNYLMYDDDAIRYDFLKNNVTCISFKKSSMYPLIAFIRKIFNISIGFLMNNASSINERGDKHLSVPFKILDSNNTIERQLITFNEYESDFSVDPHINWFNPNNLKHLRSCYILPLGYSVKSRYFLSEYIENSGIKDGEYIAIMSLMNFLNECIYGNETLCYSDLFHPCTRDTDEVIKIYIHDVLQMRMYSMSEAIAVCNRR